MAIAAKQPVIRVARSMPLLALLFVAIAAACDVSAEKVVPVASEPTMNQVRVDSLVRQYYPAFYRVGLPEETPTHEAPNARGVVPWFIISEDGDVIATWMDPPVVGGQAAATQRLQEKFPRARFRNVVVGKVLTERWSMPPVIWATLEPHSRLS